MHADSESILAESTLMLTVSPGESQQVMNELLDKVIKLEGHFPSEYLAIKSPEDSTLSVWAEDMRDELVKRFCMVLVRETV